MSTLPCISMIVLGTHLAAGPAESVDYVREIKPLLKARCYACHGALKQQAELRLDTGEAVRRGGKHGAVVLTSEVAKSPLLLRVTSTNSDERMPAEGEALTPEQIAWLRNWIDQGAPSPPNEKPEPDPREHWAFRPPLRPPVPQTRGSSFPIRNPIDAFLGAELEKHGLAPAPEATKEVLLRRVSIDLIGLPPTREQLHHFLADTAPDAFEQAVHRLLCSPQYAERWTRHWMDIWRYADWYGRRHVPDVWNSAPQVWRWRDWIVRSLNADKGYDRMLVEMVAADEVAPEDEEARSATGFLVRNWYALNPNQWMRDIVEHTGKAFLGLTFNCAHCHDHKYDPISQRDYFRFRAFFEPLQLRQDWVEGEPNPGPFQKYEYSTTRKVVTNGRVSVFDESLDAKTFLYLRGDERSFPEGKPFVEPAMPGFLRGDALKPQRLNLPSVVQYPGLKPFIQQVETQQREQVLATAKNALSEAQEALHEARNQLDGADTTNTVATRAKALADVLVAEASVLNKSNRLAVAQADLDAIRARIKADESRFSSTHANQIEKIHSDKSDSGGPKTAIDQPLLTPATADELAADASRAERLLALRQAEAKLAESETALALLQAEHALGAERRGIEGAGEKKEDQSKAEATLKKLQEQCATARKGIEAAQAALQTNSSTYTPLSPVYPVQSTGRRRALAGWMTSRDNPLTARVAVNHIWMRHFHAPLVASVFDFGRNGAQPTHPELLDWLAVEFMEHGWSMKHLHRLIVTSRAYRRSSAESSLSPPLEERAGERRPTQVTSIRGLAPDGEMEQSLLRSAATNKKLDPENRYLWRMNPGQMEAEVLRDSILFLADELDFATVGYPLPNADAERSRHRSLYFECFPEPNGQSQFAEIFDAPNPTECYRRSQTIVPQQALALANSKLSQDRSRALARRLAINLPADSAGAEVGFVIAAYEQILTRQPTQQELGACRDFLAKQSGSSDPNAARVSLIHVLFNHNDFVTIR